MTGTRVSILAKFVTIPLVAATLISCSGDLSTALDPEGRKPVHGILIKTSQVWVEEGTYTKLSKGGPCDTSTPFFRLVSLPTGPTYYVRPNTAALNKTSFSVKLNDDGTLQELSFNSEPAAADALKATSDLLKAALPALGIAGAASPPAGVLPACDTGEKAAVLTPFEKWIQAH
ncbi:hypothetical protein PQR08_35170 [Caballeronia jiangsuensis]|uniref:Lipoprotein n=1 Tax=Caballeronia jiangsuensis TaxID=1458357 RepID=A0ABW9CXN4_9BURK